MARLKKVPGLRLKCVETGKKTRVWVSSKEMDLHIVAEKLIDRSHPGHKIISFKAISTMEGLYTATIQPEVNPAFPDAPLPESDLHFATARV